ncbi:MAG: sigma-70 family RNA polymerase sigma factor [Chloroflexota bacterium]
MGSRPQSDEALVRRLHPTTSPDRTERAHAWAEWQRSVGETALRKFISLHNNSGEPDDDILQDALLTAYVEVERGRYQPRDGVPFTAYVKGIARNKLREARRRRCWPSLDELPDYSASPIQRQTESDFERNERRAALRQGLAELQGERRLVLEHYLSGDTTGEIAADLAVSEDVVRQHKCRGLRQIRLHLGLEGEGMWAAKPVPGCPDSLTRS